MAIADMHFSKRKKEHLGTKLGIKCLFLFAIIFQISSRLLTISVFGMFMFPENPYTPLILTGLCFVHIFIVFTSRCLIGFKYFKGSFVTPMRIINCMLCAFGSVFSYAKIHFDKEDRFITETVYEDDPVDPGKTQEFKNTVQEKFWQRFMFGTIIVGEQLIMYILIIFYGSAPSGFNVKLFITVTGAIFISGHLTEAILHLFFNPFARFRPYFWIKKMALSLTTAIFVTSCIGYALNILYHQYIERKEYQDLFIPIITILIMLGITIFTLKFDDVINYGREGASETVKTTESSSFMKYSEEDEVEPFKMKSTDIQMLEKD